MVKTLVPHFRSNGGGKVINISSIAGVGAFPNCPAYCASKGGVVNLTRALAAELGKEHITSIRLGRGTWPRSSTPCARAGQRGLCQANGQYDADRIAFLDPEDLTGQRVPRSDDAKMVHGATIMVDAGWSIW